GSCFSKTPLVVLKNYDRLSYRTILSSFPSKRVAKIVEFNITTKLFSVIRAAVFYKLPAKAAPLYRKQQKPAGAVPVPPPGRATRNRAPGNKMGSVFHVNI